ncbi:MAG: hypothetical protein LBS62_02090 [Clostridiales bacterium]|nr:hypothetical protein [Clostridiales bacterium]
MTRLLLTREAIVSFFKRYETACIFVIKFLLGAVLFTSINNIPFGTPRLAFLTDSSLWVLTPSLMSLAFAALTFPASCVIIILDIALHTSAVPELCVIITLFLLCLEFLYVRMAPKESVLLIIAFFAHYFKLPYALPLVAGLYFSAASVVPVMLGVFICAFIPVTASLLPSVESAGTNLSEMTATFSDVYTAVLESFWSNQQWILTAFIFALVTLVVFAVSRLTFSHAKDWAVWLGCLLMIVSFFTASLIVKTARINLFAVSIFTVLSGALVEIFRFFDPLLDYQRVERVEFEDDENLYYVKIVPKIIARKRQ